MTIMMTIMMIRGKLIMMMVMRRTTILMTLRMAMKTTTMRS